MYGIEEFTMKITLGKHEKWSDGFLDVHSYDLLIILSTSRLLIFRGMGCAYRITTCGILAEYGMLDMLPCNEVEKLSNKELF